MKPAPFTYLRPSTVDEAVAMLADGQAKVLAGGQSLVPILSMRLASPTALVDINHLPGLDAIEVDDVEMRIGALARHRAVEREPRVTRWANLLPRQALAHVAHPTIRNRGTTVGSLIHADPAAEMPAVLTLLGGSVDVTSAARGPRTIAAADLFVGPLESALHEDELAVSAGFPHPPPGSGTAWLELSRRQGDYAIAGVGAVVTLDGSGTVTAARLALIGVGPIPVLVDLGPVLAGRDAGPLASFAVRTELRDVEDLVSAAIDPEGDIHASAAYRDHLARQLSTRAVVMAVRHATDWTGGPGDDPDGPGADSVDEEASDAG